MTLDRPPISHSIKRAPGALWRAVGRNRPSNPASGPRRDRLWILGGITLALSAAVMPATIEAAPSGLTDLTDPSVSASGDLVVFTATTPDQHRSVFLLDRNSQEVTDLVVLPDARRIGDTIAPTLSDDGCVVVAISEIAFDIFRDDDLGERWDVYRLVLPACGGQPNDWQLISIGESGIARDEISPDQQIAVSQDGTMIVFTSPTDTERTTVVLVDTTEPIGSPERERYAPGTPAAEPSRPFHYRGSDQPTISGDGRLVAFRADYDPEGGTWNEGAEQGNFASTEVVVWDTGTDGGVVTPQRDDLSNLAQPALSTDGSTLAFVAEIQPDTTCRGSCPTQVMRWSLDSDDVPELVSAQRWTWPAAESAPDGAVLGNGSSFSPTLNADGSLIAFVTKATNLTISHPGGASNTDDGALLIAGRDWLAPALQPSGDGPVPTPRSGAGAQHRPDLSASGATLIFDAASELAVPESYRVAGLEATGRLLGIVTIPRKLVMAELNFGSVLPGEQSAELYTSVRNIGPSAFQPTDVFTDSDDFDVTGGTCRAKVVVSPGGSCTVRVTYVANGTGTQTATLTVADNIGTEVQAGLSGQAGSPRLRIDPAGANLGRGQVGQDVGQAVLTVTNIYYDNTEVAGVSINGNESPSFAVGEDRCTGVVLQPGEGCSVTVRYVPVESGSRSATLIAFSDTGSVAAAVVGGSASRRPDVTISADEIAPGSPVELLGSGFEPGTQMYTAIVGEREIGGPFVVADDGTVTAQVTVPFRLRTEQFQVALQDESSAVFAFSLGLIRPQQTAPTLLPGFGYG